MVSNALTASVLAVAALWVGYRFPKRPALAHACWLLVLVKLLTPPLYSFTVINITVQPTVEATPTELPPVLVTTPAVPPPIVSIPRVDPPDVEEWEIQELLEWYESTLGLDAEIIVAPPLGPLDRKPEPPSVVSPIPASTPPRQVSLPSVSSASMVSLWFNASWLWLKVNGLMCVVTLSFTGTAALLLLTLLRIVRFHRLLRHAEPAADEIILEVHRLGEQLGIKQLPGVYVVPGRMGPLLGHLGSRAVIVLPQGLLEHISADELRTVLAHELTHYRRGDHLWRYLELGAVAFYWWLPTAWLASRRLRQAEEECCDAGVLASLPELAGSYATALVRSLTYVTGSGSPCPALTSGLGPVTLLKRRLAMMRERVERRLGLRGWLTWLALAGVALPVGFTLAQDDDDEARVRRRAEVQAQQRRAELQERLAREEVVVAQGRRATEEGQDPPPLPRPRRPGGAGGAVTSTPAAPGQTPTPPGGMFGGQPPGGVMSGGFGGGASEDMHSVAESAVKQAELDLRARRLKVRAAESAAKVARVEVERSRQASRSGAVSSTEVAYAQAKLENAEIEIELAQIEVQRGELALEQAKRRTTTLGRMRSGHAGGGPSGPGGPGGGFGDGGPGGGGRGAFSGGGGQGGFGGMSGFSGQRPRGDAPTTTPAAPGYPPPPTLPPSPGGRGRAAPGAVDTLPPAEGLPFGRGRATARVRDVDETPPAQPVPPRAMTPPSRVSPPVAATPPTAPVPTTRPVPPAAAARPPRDEGDVDSRDDRIRALERELRDMRRALEEMKRSKRDEQ
jgi:beta-lactamase regulating signal transducer with metallopeptidase domain